jgi:hypothetical protein
LFAALLAASRAWNSLMCLGYLPRAVTRRPRYVFSAVGGSEHKYVVIPGVGQNREAQDKDITAVIFARLQISETRRVRPCRSRLDISSTRT